ncbi:TlpA family protein disulfide reductase [Ferruginibacter sp.]
MKRYIVLLVLAFCSKAAFSQAEPDTSLLYIKFPIVPSFRLINVADSSIFTKNDLKKKKFTIIMMFSPDCEHCQEETKHLTASIDLFKKAQIIMASPLDYGYIKKFYEEYKIADYPTITMGRDPAYFLGTFYKVRSFPSIFVYDKKGKYITSFTGSTPVEEIAASMK